MSDNKQHNGNAHEKIEKNVGLMAVLIAVVVSFGGLAEIVPLMNQAEAIQPLPGVKPYPALELAGRERRSDRKALAEVVDADPERHEERECQSGHAGAAAGEAGGEERHAERARGDAEQHEPCAAERRRKRSLELERLSQRLDA